MPSLFAHWLSWSLSPLQSYTARCRQAFWSLLSFPYCCWPSTRLHPCLWFSCLSYSKMTSVPGSYYPLFPLPTTELLVSACALMPAVFIRVSVDKGDRWVGVQCLCPELTIASRYPFMLSIWGKVGSCIHSSIFFLNKKVVFKESNVFHKDIFYTCVLILCFQSLPSYIT